MSRSRLAGGVSVLALMGIGCVSARNAGPADWQESYYEGMRAIEEGRYAEARIALQEAYDRARTPPTDIEWEARTAFGLGTLARTQGDCRTAEKFQREATGLLDPPGKSSALLAMAWNGLGEALQEQTRYEDAVQAFTKAQQLFEDDPAMKDGVFLCRRHLAEIRFERQDFAGAEKLLKALIADERKEAEAGDLAGALDVLGRLYAIEHRWAQSESLLREAIDRDLKRQGEQGPALADTRVTLAALYRLQGHVDRAEPLLRQSIKLYESIHDPHAAMAYAQLGWCALARHRYTDARDLLQKALDTARQASMSDAVITRLRDDLATAGIAYAKSLRH